MILHSTGLFFAWTASGCIDDKGRIACLAVLARRRTARSRADDGVFRQSLGDAAIELLQLSRQTVRWDRDIRISTYAKRYVATSLVQRLC